MGQSSEFRAGAVGVTMHQLPGMVHNKTFRGVNYNHLLFFCNSFTEIQFTCGRIYPCKVYTSVIFSIFRVIQSLLLPTRN